MNQQHHVCKYLNEIKVKKKTEVKLQCKKYFVVLVSDQTTISMKVNRASVLCFSLFDLKFIFIQIIFYNLT